MSDPHMSEEKRTAILESLGRREGDVMEDECGEYVVLDDSESVDIYETHQAVEKSLLRKVYLSDVELD